MADRVSQRRGSSNTFFVAAQTALVAAIGLTAKSGTIPVTAVVGVALAGVALSASWWLQLRSYRDLNRAKFDVIRKFEEDLPFKVFTDEWASLKQDRVKSWRGRYAELGFAERTIPWAFAGIYVLMAGATLMQ